MDPLDDSQLDFLSGFAIGVPSGFALGFLFQGEVPESTFSGCEWLRANIPP